jgi:protein involved in polysaccharide export with SLBB domain
MTLRDTMRKSSSLLTAVLLGAFLTGCGMFQSQDTSSSPPTPTAQTDTNRLRTDPLRIGDRIKVDFSGSPTLIPPVETEIKGDGTIRLDFIGDVKADGRTPGEMERDIQSKYVPTYYTHLNVTVTPVIRYFYVDGEINGPGGGEGGGRVMYAGPITVTRAIAAAGGFNPFAGRTKVKLFRANGQTAIINCLKALEHPELDLPVYPGDRIFIPRRWF